MGTNHMIRIIRLWMVSAAALLILLFAAVPASLAHTRLSSSQPASGEAVQAVPMQIALTFSENLDEALHTIEVSHSGTGEQVDLGEPVLSESKNVLTAALPPDLPNDTYKVVYQALSADGHPVKGSFEFEVQVAEQTETEPVQETQPDNSDAPAQEENEDQAVNEGGYDEHGEHPAIDELQSGHASSEHGVSSGTMYATSVLYYFSFLAVLGWVLWSALYEWGPEENRRRQKAGYWLQGIHLAAFVLLVAIQWIDLREGFGSAVFYEVLRGTDLGRSWLITFVFSLAGLALLFQSRYIDGVWAVLLIGAKTLRGHANMAEPIMLARLADGIHIAAASLWVGGLLALLLTMRRNKELFQAFALRFSSVALAAFIALIVTGAASVFGIAGSLQVLINTTWGWLLLAKLALVAVVIPTAIMLRRSLRAGGGQGGWLRADVLLMAAIVALTGVLTHMSPVPDREPLHWHVMGKSIHMTAELTPNLEGDNEITVIVWLPEGIQAPAGVSAELRGTEGGSTDVELAVQPAGERAESFAGFDRYDYRGTVRLIAPDSETLLITVETASGDKITYERTLSE